MDENVNRKKTVGGKVLHSQSREILCNLYHFMKREAQEGPILLYFDLFLYNMNCVLFWEFRIIKAGFKYNLIIFIYCKKNICRFLSYYKTRLRFDVNSK
jgi:hypothetical protein